VVIRAFLQVTYYLRVEPEKDPSLPRIAYTVDVIRDVPVFGIYGIACCRFVLACPASSPGGVHF